MVRLGRLRMVGRAGTPVHAYVGKPTDLGMVGLPRPPSQRGCLVDD
jgi:hypothetical protein